MEMQIVDQNYFLVSDNIVIAEHNVASLLNWHETA